MPLRVFVTNRSKPPRRKVLGLVATAAASAAAVACGGSRHPWRFLSGGEALTLSAVSERIIPTDQDAGTAGAGVVAYIDRQVLDEDRTGGAAAQGFYADGSRVDVGIQKHRPGDARGQHVEQRLGSIGSFVFCGRSGAEEPGSRNWASGCEAARH
jgi:hypothetical protein